MTSLMTLQRPDPLSARTTNIPKVGTIMLKYQLNQTKTAGEEAFERINLMTSLMTSQRPDPLSVRTINFPKVVDHLVKKSPQSDKNSQRRSILKTRTDILTDILTSGQTDTSTENKGCLAGAREPKLLLRLVWETVA